MMVLTPEWIPPVKSFVKITHFAFRCVSGTGSGPSYFSLLRSSKVFVKSANETRDAPKLKEQAHTLALVDVISGLTIVQTFEKIVHGVVVADLRKHVSKVCNAIVSVPVSIKLSQESRQSRPWTPGPSRLLLSRSTVFLMT